MSKTKEELASLAEDWAFANVPDDEECKTAIKAYLAGYDAASPQWISVKERLPEEAGDYWVYRVAQRLVDGTWAYSGHPMSVRHFDGKEWSSKQKITHWMPLPLPAAPKEEK